VLGLHTVTLTSLNRTIDVYEGHICGLCGRSLELSESVRSLYGWIRRAEGGMLSSNGIAFLRQLKRLPCNACLDRIAGENVLISCAFSPFTERKERRDGTYSTPEN
jgi:hypothetical protein